ncbi:hypothetical protein GOP47_0003007 [Adiantum capillus-veneris]|uniref:Uncharacterized protein n=1 Tax=Adiantum capillus-veneris TaxID=13818 RepID=A0A9D4VBE1_ADICA|nr:hypothetical protein GOP47_0003007 [Adiantum capillus-veneris]
MPSIKHYVSRVFLPCELKHLIIRIFTVTCYGADAIGVPGKSTNAALLQVECSCSATKPNPARKTAYCWFKQRRGKKVGRATLQMAELCKDCDRLRNLKELWLV